MRVQNQIDRFNLVKDAIMHLPQLGNKGSFLIQKMNDKLVEHKQYIVVVTLISKLMDQCWISMECKDDRFIFCEDCIIFCVT